MMTPAKNFVAESCRRQGSPKKHKRGPERPRFAGGILRTKGRATPHHDEICNGRHWRRHRVGAALLGQQLPGRTNQRALSFRTVRRKYPRFFLDCPDRAAAGEQGKLGSAWPLLNPDRVY